MLAAVVDRMRRLRPRATGTSTSAESTGAIAKSTGPITEPTGTAT
jgi:hypothetical protein